MIYQLDKDGHVRQDRRGRMWHEGRVIHPDAEPEPNCVAEYSAQAFTFRDQVKQRDGGVCAECGRDCEAELAAWYAERPDWDWRSDELPPFEVRDAAHEAWRAREPVGWDADHIVPLEDGGEHVQAVPFGQDGPGERGARGAPTRGVGLATACRCGTLPWQP
jgi:hypothetical protein